MAFTSKEETTIRVKQKKKRMKIGNEENHTASGFVTPHEYLKNLWEGKQVYGTREKHVYTISRISLYANYNQK